MIMFSSIDVIVQGEMRLLEQFERRELTPLIPEVDRRHSETEIAMYRVDVNQSGKNKGETMWIKRITALFGIAAIGLLAATAVSADSKANTRKGKAYFKKNCRVCHDGKTADAPPLEPAELIIEQWERAFTKEDGVAECVPRVKEKTGVELTEQDLIDIEAYLVQGAADSERPMTCG
jgi:mono/diheme cytochrome c family protein